MYAKNIEEVEGEFCRVIEIDEVGATETDFELYRVKHDEMIKVGSFCVENTHASQTLRVRIGVISGEVFYNHQVSASVAAIGAGLNISKHLYAREGEIVALKLTGSGANTTFKVCMQGFTRPTR